MIKAEIGPRSDLVLTLTMSHKEAQVVRYILGATNIHDHTAFVAKAVEKRNLDLNETAIVMEKLLYAIYDVLDDELDVED